MKKTGFYTTSDEAIIYYEDNCPSNGQTIVFVPGYCSTTQFFDENIETLSKNHRVITFDPRGQGRSSKGLVGHTVKRNCTDIKELLDYLDVKDAIMLGWSMAGQYIVKYFDMFGAHRIKALGLIDCPLGAFSNNDANAHGLKGFNTDLFNDHMKMSYNTFEDFCRFFAHMMYDGDQETRIEWATSQMTCTPPWIAYAIYYDLCMLNGFELLGKIDVPMVFFGSNNKVTANGRELASKWYPELAVKVPFHKSYPFEEGGHVFFQTHADEFNAKLLEFCDELK